jgi:dihydropteroate synthase
VTWTLPVRRPFIVPLPHGATLGLGERPLVMGVLNVTPDSFADSVRLVDVRHGRTSVDVGRAVDLALAMQDQGADLLDIGGESTRPGARPLGCDEEIGRVVPVVEAAAKRLRIPISVDTYKAEVARLALAAGASIVNDISGLRHEPLLAERTAQAGAALVLMHSRGRSSAMYDEASYDDVPGEVATELSAAVARAEAAGVPRDAVIVDPGIGFAKRADHSYGVLADLPALAEAVGRPLLVGVSRKSFLRDAVGDAPATSRDWATAAAVTAAVLAGAHIVRVHAIGEMVQVVKVAERVRLAASSGRRAD